MAFINTFPSTFTSSFKSSFSNGLSTTTLRRPQLCISSTSSFRPMVMTTTPPETQSEDTSTFRASDPTTSSPAVESYELDTDAIKDKAMEVVSDVSTRPFFYGKIAAYGVGALVIVTVLRAVVVAVDSIPVLPGALELIGLGYTVWFVWRYVLFQDSRKELLEEIEEFVGRARPKSESE